MSARAAVGLCLAGVWLAALAPSPAGGTAAADAAGLQFRELRLKGKRHRYAVYVPPGYDRGRAWPCVLFLHGSGECGTDGEKPTRIGLLPAVLARPERWPCLIVLPQKPREEEEWEEREELVLAVLKAVRRDFRVDPARIVLTGISQGGHGAWLLGARHPELWSCLVPVCGYGRARTVASRVAELPVWAFHGLQDDLVDPRDTQRIIEGVRAARVARGLPPDTLQFGRMTLYPEANHGSWEAAYAEPELPVWMLAQVRRSP